MADNLNKVFKTKHPVKKMITNGAKGVSKTFVVPAVAVKTVSDSLKETNKDNGKVYELRDKQSFNNGLRKIAIDMKNEDERERLRNLALIGTLGLAGASTLYNLNKGTLDVKDITKPGKQILKKVNPVYRNLSRVVDVAGKKKTTIEEARKVKELFDKYRLSTRNDLTFDGFSEMYQMYKSERKAFNTIGNKAEDFFNYINKNKNRFKNIKKQQGSRVFEQMNNPNKNKFNKDKFMKDIKAAIGLGSMSTAAGLGWNASKDVYEAIKPQHNNNKPVDKPSNRPKSGKPPYNRAQPNKPPYKKRNNNDNNMSKMASDFKTMRKIKDKVLDKDFLRQNIVGNTLNSLAYAGSGALAFKMLNRDRHDFSKLDKKKKVENEQTPGSTKTIIELPETYLSKTKFSKPKAKPSKKILKTASDARKGKNIFGKVKKGVKGIFPEDMPKQLVENATRGVTRTVPVAALAGLTGRNFQGNMEKFDSEQYRQNTLAPLERGNIRITVEKFDEDKKSTGSVK